MSHSFAASSIGQRIVADALVMAEVRKETTGEIDSSLDAILNCPFTSNANVGEMCIVGIIFIFIFIFIYFYFIYLLINT